MDPENIDALNSIATCIKNTSGPEEDFFPACLDLYQRALELDPEDFETNFNIGILYYTETPSNKKDALKAIHYLKIAIAEERSATVMFNLAVIYEEQGERGQAKEMYQEVLKINPSHFKAKVNLAIILEKEGESKKAHSHYVEALEERPGEARIYHNLGINMKRAGMLDNALDYYKRAMDLEPDNSVFLYNTSVLYNIKNDHDQAIDVLEKSIQNNKENVYAYLALGDAFEREKEL